MILFNLNSNSLNFLEFWSLIKIKKEKILQMDQSNIDMKPSPTISDDSVAQVSIFLFNNFRILYIKDLS